ncbi:hypothetical protein [uncultured Tyzzerella sp.]|uniref:hypothetical protein n=1 Tax=uncultured Tyzzerella sp. TaxID=2321398 RepID=UPI002942AE0D|nr:hypothetical protein [uncultured Tyzzerella sp.]
MKNNSKWWLLLYLVPYSYIGLMLDRFGKNTIITLIGYLSAIIPFFVIKIYKDKSNIIALISIFIGNIISLIISMLLFKLFSNYQDYNYYFKPFGTLATGVLLATLSFAIQIIRYLLKYAPNISKFIIYFFPYYIIFGYIYSIKYNMPSYIFLFLILFFVPYIISSMCNYFNKIEFIIFIILGNIFSLIISSLIFYISFSVSSGFIIFILGMFVLFVIWQIILCRIIYKKLKKT